MSAVEGSNGNGLRKDDIIFGSGRWKEETEKLYHTFDWVRIFEAQQISETFWKIGIWRDVVAQEPPTVNLKLYPIFRLLCTISYMNIISYTIFYAYA